MYTNLNQYNIKQPFSPWAYRNRLKEPWNIPQEYGQIGYSTGSVAPALKHYL
jgi:hypothetical protein